MSIKLDEKAEAVLQILMAQAQSRRMRLAEYLQLFANAGQVAPVAEPDLEEFESPLDALSEGLPPLRSLPSDFSRHDIYADHD